MLIFAITGVCEKLSMSPIIGPGAAAFSPIITSADTTMAAIDGMFVTSAR